MRSLRLLSLLLVVGVGACAHQRPKQLSPIAIPATRILATTHGAARPTDILELTPLARQAFEATTPGGRAAVAPNCGLPQLAAPPPHAPGPAQYLVLSGGSLNGAFGAGMFLGLQDIGLLPPEPDVVTGVSTGSLQSTFLFLARQPVPKDRDYSWVRGMATQSLPGATGAQPPVPGRTNIEDLALAYSIDRESQILRPYPLGGIGLLTKGAKGSLDPLRKRLMALIGPETIRAVAIEGCRGRKLFAGVTNVDDGFGYALDLTALALSAYDGNATATRMLQVRTAYVEALIASSSVPVGAKPVQLRIRIFGDTEGENGHRRNLFVDGGARFGVFLREIRDAQEQAMRGGRGGEVTLIVNTRLSIEPWHAGDQKRPTEGWHLVTLGLRTVEILENQVYQLSVAMVESDAERLHMAYLSNENLAGGPDRAETPDAHLYAGTSCADWHEKDEKALKPVQFYPNYMACLIDYGRKRGQLAQWNVAPAAEMIGR